MTRSLMSMKNYTLLTGATGLIGRYLVRDLLVAGEPLCVIVRPSKKETAEQRIESILRMWESQLNRELPRPVIFVGEVTEPGLGLDAEARAWVAANCRRLVHNAAILEFYGPDRTGEPWLTNLNGTTNVIEFCRETKVRDMHYVSTAYVSGCRDGVILEDELDQGQGFRNDYEESKFQAEKAMRAADCFDSLTVYRPAVVAGDSKTGYTSTYHGLYLYLKMAAAVIQNIDPDADGVRRVPARWNCTGDERRNIVPVDWVSAAMTRLMNNPAAQGGTFHLAPERASALRELTACLERYYNSTGLEFTGSNSLDLEQMSDLERDGYSAMAIYQSYLTTDPVFDITNLRRLLPDLRCPVIDEAMFIRFVRFGEADRWGKRRSKVASSL